MRPSWWKIAVDEAEKRNVTVHEAPSISASPDKGAAYGVVVQLDDHKRGFYISEAKEVMLGEKLEREVRKGITLKAIELGRDRDWAKGKKPS